MVFHDFEILSGFFFPGKVYTSLTHSISEKLVFFFPEGVFFFPTRIMRGPRESEGISAREIPEGVVFFCD